MSKTEQQMMFLIGIIVAGLGMYVDIGWCLTNPVMVQIIPNSPVMVFNTGLCFVCAGIWLSLSPTYDEESPSRTSRYLMGALSSVLFILPVLSLTENFANINLGIDWTARHQLILDNNVNPGRISSNACISFLFICAAFLIEHIKGVRFKKRIVLLLGILVFLIGFGTLIGYLGDLNALYHFTDGNRMAIPTATGVILIGTALALSGKSTTRTIPVDNVGEDVRLTRIAAIIMIVLSLASGLAGFVTLKQGTDQILRDELLEKAKSGSDTFNSIFERRYILADKLLALPLTAKNLASLPDSPHDPDTLAHIGKVAEILIQLGFMGLEVKDTSGKVVYTYGTIVDQPELILPIKITGQDASLYWKGGSVLHVERPIENNGVVVGKVITEQQLLTLDKYLHNFQYSGTSTDTGLCLRNGDYFDCPPDRFVPHIVHMPLFKNGAPSYPMSHALLGETGVVYAKDIRGIPVVAAYAPVGSTGLGFVVKIESTEIYGFIRNRLHILLGILIAFVLAGTYLLRLRLQPLASRLVRSEQRTRAANELLGKDAERLNQIIAVQTMVARSALDLTTALSVIVEQVKLVTHSEGAAVALIDGDELYYRATSGGWPGLTDHRMKIAGSLSGYCMQSGVSILCNDLAADPRTDKVSMEKLKIKSMIVAPLINEGVVIGALSTVSKNNNAFTPNDQQALQLLSGLIGTVIGHQQDFDEKQRLLSERTMALLNLEKITDSLRVSEERMRIIIESAYDAFIAMDSRGAITDWNKQAEAIFGWAKLEVLGKQLTDLIMPPNSQAAYNDHLTQVLASDHAPETDQRLEISAFRRSRDLIMVEMTVTPIRSGDTIMLASFLHDITDRKKTQQKLLQLAQYDTLTALPNRMLFIDRLSVAITHSERSGKALALMFLDLDGFKKINDNYGHQAGDTLLKQFANRLTATVRRVDATSRLAGDEFTIILEELTEPERDVKIIASKIIEAMKSPFDVAGQQLVLTTSIGIAIKKSGTNNIDDFIHAADGEMYKAKHAGKNQFKICWI